MFRIFRKSFSRVLYIIFATSIVGCATPTIYHWGEFEEGLHDRFVNEDHAQADVYLLETINTASEQNFKVPPGAYADYGFILFRRGDHEGAKAYFEKEKNAFPESSALMTKLIEQVKKRESGETGKLEDVFESPVQTTDIESQVTKDEKTSEVGIQNDEDHLEVETSE
jgi:hypothetical protein